MSARPLGVRHTLVALSLLVASNAWALPITVYTTDFEVPPVDPVWSDTRLANNFLGGLHGTFTLNQSTTLTLTVGRRQLFFSLTTIISFVSATSLRGINAGVFVPTSAKVIPSLLTPHSGWTGPRGADRSRRPGFRPAEKPQGPRSHPDPYLRYPPDHAALDSRCLWGRFERVRCCAASAR